MNKCESECISDEREDMIDDWHSDSGCIPREVNVILSPRRARSSEPHTKHSSQDQDTIACDENNCFSCDDVPHLIGVDDIEQDEDE